MSKKEKLLPPIHPGEIINGERNISIDTALRLSKCFGMSAQMWMNLQTDYELRKAHYDHLTEQIEQEVREYSTSKWAHATN